MYSCSTQFQQFNLFGVLASTKNNAQRKSFVFLCGLLLSALPSTSALADAVFSTFGPGQTYTHIGYGVGLAFNGEILVWANVFNPTETVPLTDVVLPAYWISGTTNSPLTVYIESASLGVPSGTILDTLSQVGTLSTTPGLFDFVCSSRSELDAGTQYFLVVKNSDGTNFDDWMVTSFIADSALNNTTGSLTGPWRRDFSLNLGAFEVNGTPPAPAATTPEPSSLILLGTGLIGAVGAVRRRILV